MSNHLENTWVAFAFLRPQLPGGIDSRLARVRTHYGSLVREPLIEERAGSELLGMAMWRRENPALAAPLWSSGERITAATTSALTGWRKLAPAATDPLAGAGQIVLDTPERVADLNPPFVISVIANDSSRMVIANDTCGTARLFEMSTDEGFIWSNRLGALPLMAGTQARIDESAWRVLAATGFFPGELTALRDARQLRALSSVTVTSDGTSTSVESRRNESGLAALVGPRRVRLRRATREAADAAIELAEDMERNWNAPIRVDLSGGRDSRISAAAALASGINCELRTSDLEYGEVDLVNDLLGALPSSPVHRIVGPEAEPDASLKDRISAIHTVHDGMVNPQAIRAPMTLPHGPLGLPVMSGHGGELGHGFYYGSAEKAEKLGRGGDQALLGKLLKDARKKHSAATPESYEAFAEEASKTLAEGRSLGIDGADLLDYYYLAQRLANRSGLTTRNERWSACATPEFVRGCFDLTPKHREQSHLHRKVVAALLPEWKRAPYFEPRDDAPDTKRTRLWEKPGHREEVTEIVEEDDSWHDMFQPDVVREAWAGALEGSVNPQLEGVFTRVVWRSGYEAHLATLSDTASMPR